MIIAVDFDGTIVTHEYPEIGRPIKGAIETIKTIIDNGHKVFLWTMRCSKKYQRRDLLQEAADYCNKYGIELYGANTSPSQFSTSNKQYAHLYIDDAALGCPLIDPGDSWDRPYVDWYEVGKILVEKNVITIKQFNEIWNE